MKRNGQDAFEARLKRISKAPAQQYLAGEGDVKDVAVSAAQLKRGARRVARGEAGPHRRFPLFQMLLAPVLGGAALLAARVINFHALGTVLAELGPDWAPLAGQLALGIVLLVTGAFALKMRGGLVTAGLLAGFGGMFVGEAEVARHAPELWQAMFSAPYTSALMTPDAGALANIEKLTAAFAEL